MKFKYLFTMPLLLLALHLCISNLYGDSGPCVDDSINSINYFTVYTGACGTFCLLMDLLVILLGIIAPFKWIAASRREEEWQYKRLDMMRFPKLLFGAGIVAALVGAADFSWGMIGGFFCVSGTSTLDMEIGDWSVSMVSLVHGGVAFSIAWIQYGLYRMLLRRMESTKNG